MPQGSKEAYTDKQKRKAQHIEEGYLEKGVPRKKAERIAWATVNKEDGGGKKKTAASLTKNRRSKLQAAKN